MGSSTGRQWALSWPPTGSFSWPLTDQQGQDNRDGEGHYQPEDRDPKGIPHNLAELVRVDEPDEVLETHPRTSREAVNRVVVAEGDLHSVHRPVLEHRDVDEGRR